MTNDRDPHDEFRVVSPSDQDEEDTLLGEVTCWTHDELISAATLVHMAKQDAFQAASERIKKCSIAICNIASYLPKIGRPREEWERGDEEEIDADPDLAAIAHETIGRLLAEIHMMLEPVDGSRDGKPCDFIDQLRSVVEDTLL